MSVQKELKKGFAISATTFLLLEEFLCFCTAQILLTRDIIAPMFVTTNNFSQRHSNDTILADSYLVPVLLARYEQVNKPCVRAASECTIWVARRHSLIISKLMFKLSA